MARPCSFKSASHNQSHIPLKGVSRYCQPRKQIVNCSLTNGRSFEPSEPQHVPLLHGYKCAKMTCIPTEPSLTRRKNTSRVLPVFSTFAATFAASRLFTPPSSRTQDQNSRTTSRSLIMILGVRRCASQLVASNVIHRGTMPPDIPIVF